MASVLLPKSDIRKAGRSISPTATQGKPSKIPVRSDSSSGSASDDSDDAAKSSLRAKRSGKSKIPRAVPVEKVATSTEATGSKTLQKNGPQMSGVQRKSPSTSAKRSSANPKVGEAKVTDKKTKGGLKRKELTKESPSFNEARSNTLGTRQLPGILKKSSKTSKITSNSGGKARKTRGLPGEEQEKSQGTTAKKSTAKHPVIGKVNNEKLPLKNRQKTASASKKKTTPSRVRKDDEKPSQHESDVHAIKKEEDCDSSLSENSSESNSSSFDYEAGSDDLPVSDSDAESVPKVSQSQAEQESEKQDLQEIVENGHGLQCVPEQAHATESVSKVSQSQVEKESEKQDPQQSEQDNGHGLQSVPEAVHDQVGDSTKEQKLDGSGRRVTFCEPQESERRSHSRIRGFSDELRINIDFVYETESDEFTSSKYSESSKDQCKEKEEAKEWKMDSPAQLPGTKEHSLHETEEDLALTDCEIESIAEDIDMEQPVCFPKQNNELYESATAEKAKDTEEDILGNSGKTTLETAKEAEPVFEVKISSEETGKSSVPKSNESKGPTSIPDENQSENSDDSFFGINVTKFYGRNTTRQVTMCMAEDIKPKEKTFLIEGNDLQVIDDADYIENNCESKEKESHVLNAIKDEVNVGIPLESVSEGGEGKIHNEGNRNSEEIQKCCSFEQIPYQNGKDKKKKPATVDEDPFITELDELLSEAEADIEEDSTRDKVKKEPEEPQKTAPLIEDEYIPYKPPIAPKQQPKQKAVPQDDETDLDRVLKSEGVSKRGLDKSKECLPEDSLIAEPKPSGEEACSPGETNPDVLLRRKVKQAYDGILKASDESSKKGDTASTRGTSGMQSTQADGRKGISVTTGMSDSGSTTAGGSGDDDPNDPTKRPQRQKEPDDKEDEELERQKRKAAKKALINKMMGITDGLLQNEFQSLAKTHFTRRPNTQSAETLEKTECSEQTLPQKQGTSLEVSCSKADDEKIFNRCTGESDNDGALIKALTNENALLKKEVLNLKKEINQKAKEVMQAYEKNKTYKNVISNMEVDLELLEVEKIELTQGCKDSTNEDMLKELKRIQTGISEASKELASEDDIGSELKGPTSSPLSVELAEIDGFHLKQQPEVDETNEIVTLMHSITAMTEELRDQIVKSKVKLAKAYSNSSLNEVEEMNGENVRELHEEIADLQEQLEDERIKFATFDSLYNDRNEENKKLRDRITDLEIELAKNKDRLKDMITYKNRELNNIRNNMETKGNKVDELVHELRSLSEGNDALKSVIESLNSRIRFREYRETELENTVDELTAENERLLLQISKERGNMQKYQRENDRQMAANAMEVARLESALQDKIDELVHVLGSIDNFYAGDQPLPDHPCVGDIENGIKILYDVSGLLKAIRCTDLQSGEVGEPLKETKERELEIMIENLRQEVDDLKIDKQRLELKLRLKTNAEGEEDTGKVESRLEDEMMLRQQLDEREEQLNELEQQITTLQSDNASLSQILGDVKELAAKDAEARRLQLEGYLNRIEVLQEENDKQKVQIKSISESLLECKEKCQTLKNEKEDLELGKEALQHKVQLKVKEVLEHMEKYETMRKNFQEVTTERKTLQQKLQKRDKELSEQRKKIEALTDRIKTIDAEKEILQQKLRQDGQKVENEANAVDTKLVCTEVDGLCKCTTAISSGETNELQVQNEELREKMEMYEAFLEQVKTEKADYVKALEESRQNVMMIRKSSDEQIAKLKKDLEGKDLSENELQKTIKLLEERIATLEAEKSSSVKLMKAIVERIQGDNKLEKCRKELLEPELELQNSNSAPRSEKADVQKELLAKVAESFDVRMKEFDECLQYRHALQEELACLKDLHKEQKKELESVTQENCKMNEEIKEKETEVRSIRRTSSEMISDLESRLKGREGSALELQERATFLSQKLAQFEAEKFESDEKINNLMEALNAKEDMINLSKETKNSEEQSQSDSMLFMKKSQEKIITLEKELQNRSESETTLQNKVCSLELRISELNAEKTEREHSMKTLLEALKAKKNLEEYVQNKDQVEKELLRKMEEMKAEFSKLRSAKEDLEHQLAIPKGASQQSHDLEGSAKLETELKNQIDKLSNEKIKTERMLQEKESQVLLVKKTSEAKIEDLENQLRSKSLSGVELQEKMRFLQHKILLLEGEKVRHSKSISSMVKILKAKEELSEAVKGKGETEKEYNMKLDEMELIVNKLRKEKSKHDCDMDLKNKYKNEYEKLRHHVKKLTDNIYMYDKRVEELQSIVDGHEEREYQREEFEETDLSENIEDLRNSLGSSDAELIQTQQALQAKISSLELENAEFESVLTALLNSLEAKENIGYCVEATREADKKMVKQMDGMLDAVQRLKAEKERVERELYASENIRVAMALDVEVLQTQSNEKISLLEQSLKESFEAEKDLNERLELMSEELTRLEDEKHQADVTLQTILASFQGKEKLEECLKSQERIEKVLKANSRRELKIDPQEAQSVASLIEIVELKERQLEKCKTEKEEAEKALKAKELSMREEFARLEDEKQKANQTLQTILASLQGKEKLEQCLKEQGRIESVLKAESRREQKVDPKEAQSVASLIELLESKEQQLEQCKKEKEEAEKSLKAKELELELRAKDAKKQSRDFEECLKEKNETFKSLVGEIEKLKANITMAEEENKGLLQKLDKHSKVSEEREEEVKQIIQREQNLHERLSYAENILQQLKDDKYALKKQLRQEKLERENDNNSYVDKIRMVSDAIEQKHAETESELCQRIEKLKSQIVLIESEKEASIDEYRKAEENLNMELLLLTKRKATQREQMNDLEAEVAQTKEEFKKQVKLQKEKEIEIENLKSERKLLSENVTKLESKLMNEMEGMLKREAEVKQEKEDEIKKLKSDNDVIVGNLKAKMTKLEKDLECQVNKEANLREEKEKLIEELKLQENMAKEIDQLKSTIKTVKEEGRKLREERRVLQSKAARSAKTLRDTITRLEEDIKNQNDTNKDLQVQLDEMETKESFFNEEKSRHEHEISVYEDRIQRQKEILENFKRKLKNQREQEQCMKKELTSQVNELQLEITRLTEVRRMQEEERTDYDSNVRRLKIRTENLEAQINDQKNELMESRAKISVLEEMKVQSDAELERRQQQVVSECKRANAKIDELRQELRLDLQSTSALENEIQTLKGKTAEIHRRTEAQKTDIASLYGISKGIIAKDEEQIEKLKKGSEELRGQVLCLQEEKKALASTVDGFQLFVARHRVEMEHLENKIKEQEQKMYDCQEQSSENTQGIKAIQSSLDNSERLRNTWNFYDDFKKWYHSTESIQRPYSRIGRYSSTTRFH